MRKNKRVVIVSIFTFLCWLAAIVAPIRAGDEDEFKFLVGHRITRAALSPDGKTLAVCGQNLITTWDLAKGKRKTTLKGHKGAVNSIAFSADGGMILAGCYGPQVKLWRLSTGEPKFVTDDFIGAHNVAVSPDGIMMASAGAGRPPTIHLFDTNGKELAVLKGHKEFIHQIAFLPNRLGDVSAPTTKTGTTTDQRTLNKHHQIKVRASPLALTRLWRA